MANPFDTLGIPLEEKEKEQSNIPSSSSSTSDNPFDNIGENFTEPSAVRMAQYGASQETFLLGDLKRLTSAGIQSIFSDKSFSEERKEEEDKRLKKLYEAFPEFETGRYESNPYVWSGRAAVMISDPVYWLMPWTRAAQAGKLLGRGGVELAKLGGGVGAVDAATRSLARTGEINLSSVAWGAGGGALLAPATTGVMRVAGAGLNKAFPRLFKDKTKEVEKILNDTHKKNYNVDDKGLQKLYQISELPNIKRAFANSLNLQNNYQNIIRPMVDFVDEISRVTDITKALKQKKNLFDGFKTIAAAQEKGTILLKGTKPYKFKLKSLGGKTLEAAKIEDIQKFSTQIKNELNEFAYKSLKEQAEATTKLQIQITKEIHKQAGLTGQIGRVLAVNFTRPLVGGAGGGTLGTLFTDSDEGFYTFVGLGLAVGGLNRVLMRGGIKGIPKVEQVGFAKVLKKEYFTNLDRSLRILFASTQQSSLSNRGPILDRFSNLIFDRPTDTVRLTGILKPKVSEVDNIGLIKSGTNVETNIQMQIATFSKSIVDDVIQGASKEVQANAVKIVRGASETFDLQSQQMAVRIREFLNKFRTYYKDVGFTEKELLDFYFPRQYNFKLINASKENQDEFLDLVTQAFRNVTKNASTKNPVVLGSRTVTKVVGNKTITKTVPNKITKPFDDKAAREAAEKHLRSISDSQDEIIKFAKTERGQDSDFLNYRTFKLPLSSHVEYERMLKGSYDDVEKVLEKYLVNDVGAVLHSLTRESVKSVEFARVFGPRGELIQQFIKQLRTQYKNAGFQKTSTGGYGSQYVGDVKAIKNAVNSLFGRYGKTGDPYTRSVTAVLSSLANFNMMDKVTLANFGDLIQPFQNSRYLMSAFYGLKSAIPFRENNLTRNLALQESKLVQQNLKDAYVGFDDKAKEFSTKAIKNEKFIDVVRAGNEKFFKFIGLEEITNTARRYAYTVGIIDSHKTAKSLVKYLRANNLENFTSINQITKQSALKDLQHLIKTGAVRVDGQGNILNKNTLIKFGSFKNIDDAGKDTLTLSLMDRIGTQAANRDAIIPQVGNRLLFTQTRNPWLRLLGQFSAWAMAKSAQTNAMLSRIDDGDLRTAIGMVGSLVAFGGVHDLRNFAKTGEFKGKEMLEGNPQEYLAHAIEMSGNIGWLPTFLANATVGWSAGRPMDSIPAASMFKDIVEFGAAGFGAVFNKNSYEKALKELYDFLPAPTVRRIIDRLGVPGFVYKKDINILNAPDRLGNPDSVKLGDRVNLFSKGGVADKRMSFSEGGFADAFAEARSNKQELFTWQGNSYTTRRADETDQQYQNFLGKSVDNKVVLKEEPYAPADQKEYNNVLAGNAVVDENIIIPKKKPVLEKKENIIIPKKKPIIKAKEDKGLEFPSIVSKAEAAIVEQPNENTKAVENFAKEENENTEIISAPFRLLANSFWNKLFGKKEGDMFTNNDFDKGTVNVLQVVAKNAINDGRNYTHYTDYPLTKRGVSAEALVGEYKDKDGNLYSAEYKKKLEDEVNAVYPNNILGKAKFAYDIATDPVMKAIFSIGGFSLQKNNQGYFINERFNFNTANKTEGTALKKIRKVISNMKDAPMDENEGPEVFINLGNIENTKVALKMAKGDTTSRAWMRDYYFDGKGGYDTFMSFEEFATGPGIQLYLNSRKKSKGGVIRKHFRYGGDTMGGRNDRSRSSNRGGGRDFASARAAMTSNRAYTGGSTARENYISNQYKGGGNGGSSSNNNNNNNNTVKSSSTNTTNKRKDKKIRVDTNVPVPGDNKKDITNKFRSIFDEEQLQVKGEYKTDGLLSPSDSFKIGATGYVGLQSAGNSITDFTPETGAKFTADYMNNNINTGVAYDTNYDVGTFEFQKKFDSGVNLNTALDTEGNKFIGVSLNFKKGGLLDKKRG